MSAGIDGIIARLAEIIAERQEHLSLVQERREATEREFEDRIGKIADEERTAAAELREIELTRRTLLRLQASI